VSRHISIENALGIYFGEFWRNVGYYAIFNSSLAAADGIHHSQSTGVDTVVLGPSRWKWIRIGKNW